MANSVSSHCPTRHGENSGQLFNAAVAQALVLSLWHVVHGFGTFNDSVVDWFDINLRGLRASRDDDVFRKHPIIRIWRGSSAILHHNRQRERRRSGP